MGGSPDTAVDRKERDDLSPGKETGWSDLGDNKGGFGAQLYALYRARKTFEARNESGRQYTGTVFSGSVTAISQTTTDGAGPGQRFAIAVIEVGERIQTQGNDVTIPWTPNMADVWANAAAESPADAVERKASLRTLREKPPRQVPRDQGGLTTTPSYKPQGKQAPSKMSAWRWLADTALSGHATTGSFLCNRLRKIPSDRCWWRGSEKRQACHHLFVKCKHHKGKSCGRASGNSVNGSTPRPPLSGHYLTKERSPCRRWGRRPKGSGSRRVGARPHENVFSLCGFLYLSFVIPPHPSPASPSFCLSGRVGAGEQGAPQ